jgi:hypothetical protein
VACDIVVGLIVIQGRYSGRGSQYYKEGVINFEIFDFEIGKFADVGGSLFASKRPMWAKGRRLMLKAISKSKIPF